MHGKPLRTGVRLRFRKLGSDPQFPDPNSRPTRSFARRQFGKSGSDGNRCLTPVRRKWGLTPAFGDVETAD